MKSRKKTNIFQEQMLPINGVQLWTAVEGKGTPTVLCHGGPSNYSYLAPVVDMIADLCRVVRYDQRGSGQSQAIIGGHSWGACLALAYAVRFPVHTVAVLHIAGTGIDMRWQEEYRENRLNALNESEREEYQYLQAQREHATDAEWDRIRDRLRFLSSKTDVFDPNRVGDLPSFDVHPISYEASERLGADWKEYTKDSRFQQSLYNLSIPVFCLHGTCDPRPSHFIETLTSKLPCGMFASIPEAGHYPWVEKPDEVKTSLRQFICNQVI